MLNKAWKNKSLSEFSPQEWESLCDRCGLCCMLTVQDEDTDEIYPTGVACKLLDDETCFCSNYSCRKNYVPDCVSLTPEVVAKAVWLPKTCAYRLIREGKELFPWHHLISGSFETVHTAGISARSKIEVYDSNLETEEDVLNYVILSKN